MYSILRGAMIFEWLMRIYAEPKIAIPKVRAILARSYRKTVGLSYKAERSVAVHSVRISLMEEIKQQIKSVAGELFNIDVEVELARPDEQFGDYATNVALQLAKQLNKNPRQLAEQIVQQLKSADITKAEVAGPGFINIWLNDEALLKLMGSEPAKSLKNQVIVSEYSDPNPFKELHIGHLFDSVLGEAIAKLCELAGATVHRVNFGGDVGLHVGKALWGIIKELGGEHPEKLDTIKSDQQANWLASCYVQGSAAYEDDPQAKKRIIEYNKQVYLIHVENDHQSKLAQIYWTCRQWSYDYFEDFYKTVGTKFDKYYPESATTPAGFKAVKEQLKKGVFKESQGAVIFPGEVHSLHTRVFINSHGLPTYETRDIGLALCKQQDYKFDQTIILTGNDIVEYMKVVLAALSQFKPDIAKRTKHLTHGMVKLAGGKKMSSRKGNVIRAVDVLDMTTKLAKDKSVAIDAVKYAFLKQRYIADIIYDPNESVSIEGNSGPYIQYAHVRAKSILRKSKLKPQAGEKLEPGERSLVRKIGEYAEVVDKAVNELMPHHICTYLYELAQTFNSFYEHNRVIGDKREALRLSLVQKYADTLKKGLNLLNISAPEKM